MVSELRSSGHALGESSLHLQFTPAYRRDIFADQLVRELTVAYIVEKAQEMKVQVPAIECGPDHLHVFVSDWHRYAPSYIAQQLKGFSAFMMRKGHKQMFEHKLWGEKFWSGGYFYRTVGAVNAETVKRYIEEGQAKHWQRPINQKTLYNYAN